MVSISDPPIAQEFQSQYAGRPASPHPVIYSAQPYPSRRSGSLPYTCFTSSWRPLMYRKVDMGFWLEQTGATLKELR